MAIDFGAFEQGANTAKKNFWTDVRNSQDSLIRDVAVQDGLQLAKTAQDKEWASSYLAPLIMDQQRAAASGVPIDEWYQRATASILNDPNLSSASPERQQRVLDQLRAQGVTTAEKLVAAGNPQRALELNKSMGLNLGPNNIADPTQVFYASGLADIGFKADPQTGMWVSPTGQKIEGYKAATALSQYGQKGLLNLLAVQADEQQKLAQGVQQGTHVAHTDAQGNVTYRPKTPIELKLEADKQQESFRRYKLEEAVKTNPGILTNPDMARMFVQSSGDPGMMNTLISMNAEKQQAPAGAGQSLPPGSPPAGTPVIAAQIQQATGVSTPPTAFGLDPHSLPDMNTPPAMTPYQQALAASQAASPVEEQKASLQTWLGNLKTTPTAQDRAWVNQMLLDNPELMKDEQLMSSLMGVFPQ